MGNIVSWLPTRELDLEDLCRKWKAGLGNPANVTSFGMNGWEAVYVAGVPGVLS